MDAREEILEFLENCRKQNRSLHTIKNYRSDLIRFYKWYRRTRFKSLSRISSKDISDYERFLSKGIITNGSGPFGRLFLRLRQTEDLSYGKISVNSRKRHFSTIKNFFEYLVQTRSNFKSNPVKSKIHGIRVKDIDISHTKMITKEDWNRLMMNTIRFSDRVMFSVMYYGGLRISEIKDLKIAQIDLRNHSFSFYRKGGELHHLTIPWSGDLFSMITEYLRMRRVQSDYLFCQKNGKQYSLRTLHRHIERLLMKAGCDSGLTPHSFRKACATNLYRRTKDLLKVRDFLNHKDAKVTQTYIA